MKPVRHWLGRIHRVLQSIRNTGRTLCGLAHTRVFALGANAMPRNIEKRLEADCFRYLTKPIKVNEFMDAFDVALEFAQTQAARAAKKEQT